MNSETRGSAFSSHDDLKFPPGGLRRIVGQRVGGQRGSQASRGIDSPLPDRLLNDAVDSSGHLRRANPSGHAVADAALIEDVGRVIRGIAEFVTQFLDERPDKLLVRVLPPRPHLS